MIKQRLELDWIGKEDAHILEPRILIPDELKSQGERNTQNILIHGDNLLSLKALESEFCNKIKCIYIDPPYNTGSAFEQYDDGLEHSLWLSLMKVRLEHLKKLLTEDGSIWISIDDNEFAYLKVLMDEIFGRSNFVATIIWHKVLSVKNSAKHFSTDHDYILVYAKNANIWSPNQLPITDKQKATYKNPDNDPRGPWQSVTISARNPYSKGLYSVKCPGGRVIEGPPAGRYWSIAKEKLEEFDRENRIYWGKDGNGAPRKKLFLSENIDKGKVPQTYWHFSEAGHTQDAKKESLALFGNKAFATPKPEKLLQRIIAVSTNPGDFVLDSFAGSGTTGAVAHKMRRHWIMVELGDHCHTHIAPRLTKVIEGKDHGGVTETEGWSGGGGFKFMTLAPSLLEKDDRGNWIISKKYNATMLAAAVCKHEGFKFHPDPKTYWKQGYSTEKDFIFVTTQFLTSEQLQRIHDQLKPDETLLICAKAFKVPANKFDKITLKKIPQSLLTRGVEFGKDNYSLPIQEEMEMDAET